MSVLRMFPRPFFWIGLGVVFVTADAGAECLGRCGHRQADLAACRVSTPGPVVAAQRSDESRDTLATPIASWQSAARDPADANRCYRLVKPDLATQAGLIEMYDKLPLGFEANQGQSSDPVKFMANNLDYTIFLTSTQALLFLRRPNLPKPGAGTSTEHQRDQCDASDPQSAVIAIGLLGARQGGSQRIRGLEQLPGTSNYFIGNDPEQWHTRIPRFASVIYESVYPGIDLIYHGDQHELEFDLAVAPGADPKAITLNLEGSDDVHIDTSGDLVLRTQAGEMRLRKPSIYQWGKGTARHREMVAGRYLLKGPRQVGFAISPYDPSRPLIIDPVLAYSTYLGGTAYDSGVDIAVDSSGNAYVTGFTNSSNFPTTKGAFSTRISKTDAFVLKLNPAAPGAASLIYSTFLGGNSNEYARSIAVDSSGNAYVTGQTFSTNFPTTRGAFSTANKGIADAFVTKLSSDGSSLVYSTYLGGSGIDEGRAIALDSLGNAYVTGLSFSTDFPTTNPIQATKGLDADAFVTGLAANGSSLLYSTYLGGSGYDRANSIAVDSAGNAYVTGQTTSSDFPTAAPLQSVCGSCPARADAFVAKIAAGGFPLAYSTYLGGSGDDQGNGIAVDSSGNVYVTGLTYSANFPTTSGAYSRSLSGFGDAFVIKLNASGSMLAYSTYLGGNQLDYGQSVAIANGNAYITGQTLSTNFPTVVPIQPACGTSSCSNGNAFVTELNPSGSAPVFSTYLGGAGLDQGNAIAVDSLGNAYLTGDTSSSAFPTAVPFQSAFGGGSYDAFVAEIALAPAVSLSPASLTFASQTVGMTSAAQAVMLNNTGTAGLSITSIVASGDYVQSNTCGSAVAAGGSCTISVTFTPTAVGTRTGAITVTDNASDSPQTVSLTGTGGGTGPAASLSPASLTFTSQPVGVTSAAQAVTLNNTGNASLSITSIVASGDYAQSNTCGSAVAAGGSCTISVTFTPTAVGTRTGAITITDNASDSPQTVSLTGTGTSTSPTVSLSPASLTFTSQPVGMTSAAQAVTLNNTGNASLSITSIVASGDYAQSNTCGSAVAAGGSCTISVTFTPTAVGTRPGAITITDNASDSPQTVSLTGTGTSPTVSLSPSSLTFASQPVGMTSAAQAVTLSNTGNASLSITSIVASGDYAQSNTCGSAVAAGGSCTISVTFTPTAVGTRTGAITITDNASNSPQTVSLTGTGISGGTGPIVSLLPGSLTFLSQPLGTTSTTQTVTLNNTGSASLNITSIVASGDYAQTNTCGSSVAGGASCTISVTFTPTAVGTRTGAITVTDNAIDSPESVPLTGAGAGLVQSGSVAAASITSLSLAFNSNNTAGNLIVVAVRSGGVPTNVSSVSDTLGNTYTQANSVYNSTANNSISTYYAKNIAAGANTVTVKYSTSNKGALAIFEYSGLDTVAPLDVISTGTGNSTAPNSGNATTRAANEILFGTLVLPAADTATVTAGTNWTKREENTSGIRFATEDRNVSATGTYAATFTLSSGDQWAAAMATFKAASAVVSLSPGSLTFAGQTVGTTSTAQAVTLSNTGSVSLGITSIVASGDYAQTNTCTSTVSAGASCTISVTFTPTAVGTRTGTITITDNASNSPQTISLTGTGN